MSVGEVQASAPLVHALLARFPEVPLVLTTGTATGRARARALFTERVDIRYVPIDLPGAVRRFFQRVNPALAVILETEIWPNLYHRCGRLGIPLVLASARISPRSVKSYRRLVGLFRQTLAHGIFIAAQSEQDAERFRSIGASPDHTHVVGNIKFDFTLPPNIEAQGAELRRLLGMDRPVWVAGSTHAHEEDVLIAAHRQLRARYAQALLVLVPRHPPRFSEVADSLRAQGVNFVTRSSGAATAGDYRGVPGRQARRVAGVLRGRRRRLRRRQPGADRRPQPARAGLARPAGAGRTQQFQLRRHRAPAGRVRRRAHRARRAADLPRPSASCWPTPRRAATWAPAAAGQSRRIAARSSA